MRFMMCKRMLVPSALIALVSLFVNPVSADIVSGDPSGDAAWNYSSVSLQNGNYIRGRGTFGFDVYTTAYDIASGSKLVTSGWGVGESVLAVGGVRNSTVTTDAAGWTGSSVPWNTLGSSAALNSRLNSDVRIVAKFGTAPTSYPASTVAPGTGSDPTGNGGGSFSGGFGGNGSILLGTNVGNITSTNATASQVIPLTLAVGQHYNGSSAVDLTATQRNDIGRLVYTFNGGLLYSWELYLNTTRLATIGLSGSIPDIGDAVNITLQDGTSSAAFTDTRALITAAAVPEPAAYLFGGIVCGVVGLGMAWRRWIARAFVRDAE